MRSRSLPAERSSWSWMRCGTISSKNGANSGSGKPWIVTPGSYWTGSVVEVSRQQGQFSMLAAKDITDTMSGVLRTSDMALWNGTDTDLVRPTT